MLRFRLQAGYDIPRISQKLDFINVMTYDLRGPWDGKADHHSPIETRASDSWAFKALNTKNGLEKWIEKGTPREKLIMGIPFFGRTFTLANPNNNKPGARVRWLSVSLVGVKMGAVEGQRREGCIVLCKVEIIGSVGIKISEMV